MTEATDIPVISFRSAEAWERWLAENHSSSNGLWVRLLKKGAHGESVTYDEAVEVALCYGWIDGQGKGYDSQSHLQKFTPRRARSVWSRLNTLRAERLMAEGRMKPAGLAQVEAAKADGRWARAYDPPSSATIPDDFMAALSKNKKAKAFFETLDRRNTYPIAYRLQTAKKAETREKRIREIVAMLERAEKFYP